LLLRSWSAKQLAVRQVTQDNQGKRTAGIDGVKSLTPPQRHALAASLSIHYPARPTRRVWIPKPGNPSEQRPLGIPVMRDRASQALVKLVLEPEWEARFEPNSYGFRPGRSGHDAIHAIFNCICRKPKYVLDADIAKCFDRIDHQALLTKLATFPALRRCIRRWLQAGVMDGSNLFPTTAGTPQGGVISPLLANVALHGLETMVQATAPRHKVNGRFLSPPHVIRYADDFVVLHPERAVIEACQHHITTWLRDLGLELKPSKTRLAHTLQPTDGSVGFDFLGFHVRQFPVGKTHGGKTTGRRPTRLGFMTLITPSKTAIQRHDHALARIIRQHQSTAQATLIQRLNPVIRGWSSYYATVSSSQVFSSMGNRLYHKLWAWAKRRHPNKPRRWIAEAYWHPSRGSWTFATTDGVTLTQHRRTPIRRHIKVQGAKSPYDGDWSYWTIRMGRHPEAPPRVAAMVRRQKGRCPLCGLYLRSEDIVEVDHLLPRSQGGDHRPRNLQIIHRHCHHTKTAHDRLSAGGGTDDNSQTAEEPDEAKVSRPVLKTSRSGD
jgi:RNA-directed DNA polymerase